jgi:hypothetical protein
MINFVFTIYQYQTLLVMILYALNSFVPQSIDEI